MQHFVLHKANDYLDYLKNQISIVCKDMDVTPQEKEGGLLGFDIPFECNTGNYFRRCAMVMMGWVFLIEGISEIGLYIMNFHDKYHSIRNIEEENRHEKFGLNLVVRKS